MPWPEIDPERYAIVGEMLKLSVGHRYLTDADGDTEYAKWLILVDVFLVRTAGAGYHSVKADWRAAYANGTHPHQAAQEALSADTSYVTLARQGKLPPLDSNRLVLSAGARATIEQITEYIRRLRGRYGPTSSELRDAEGSLLTCVLHTLRKGGYVIRDGDLTLAVTTSEGHRYGVVFRLLSRRHVRTNAEPPVSPGTWDLRS